GASPANPADPRRAASDRLRSRALTGGGTKDVRARKGALRDPGAAARVAQKVCIAMTRPRAHHPASTAVLSHFTRAAGTASALDNLVSILKEGVVRGGRPVVCLFDVPLPELRAVLVRENRRRYEPFGVAVDRRYAFRMGARPVVYLPWREARTVVAPAEQW